MDKPMTDEMKPTPAEVEFMQNVLAWADGSIIDLGNDWQGLLKYVRLHVASLSRPEAEPPTSLDSDQERGLEEEIERQEGLAKIYRQAQLTAEEKLCREQANAAGWKRRAEYLESQLKAAQADVDTTTCQSPSEDRSASSTSTDAKPADTKAGPDTPPTVEHAAPQAEVGQRDRERAADLYLAMEGEPHSPFDAAVARSIRMGNNDHWEAVQAFAKHRLDTGVRPSAENTGNIIWGDEEWVPLSAYREAMSGWKAAIAALSPSSATHPGDSA